MLAIANDVEIVKTKICFFANFLDFYLHNLSFYSKHNIAFI